MTTLLSGLKPGRLARHDRHRTRGQTMVEFALAFPIFFALLMAAIQFGLLLIWYGDEVRLTRDSTRWLALNPSMADAKVADQIRAMMLPTMIGGPPSGTVQGDTLTNHDKAEAVYNIGNLTAKFTPCLPDAAVPPNCTHPDRSSDGGTVHVELSYDASSIIFLPTRLTLPFVTLQMPTALPPYPTWMSTE